MIIKSSLLTASSLAIALMATNANAELHQASLSVSYVDQTTELSALGESVDVDSDGIGFAGNLFLSDNLSVGASLIDMELEGVIDVEVTSLGATYHFSRTDLRLGEGTGASVGIRRTNTEVSLGSLSADEDFNYVELNFSSGLGNGMSLNGGYTTDLDEVGDNYAISVGIAQSFGDAIIGAQYVFAEETSDGILTSETDGFSISVGYLF
ncbi:hypothetical protein N9P30_03405 [Alphaproteobacteria bacterium]|nr:hypothetical protein [Alphaproteobacteria bacterium]